MRLSMLAALIGPVLGGCASGPARAQDLADAFERVSGSVVTITTSSRAVVRADGMPRLAAERGLGSGVLISEDGLVMTASHVVHTSDAVGVMFPDGHQASAEVISSDPMTDLALIRIKGDLPDFAYVAPIADSDRQRIGSQVFIIGAPRGMAHTLTVGHLSARRRSPKQLQGLIDIEIFQTDASVNPGNSGGPMFNMNGEVIGIVSHIVTTSGGDEGLGFAITSNVARQVLLELPAFWSGLDTVIVQGELARALNIPGDGGGILVQRVAMGSGGYRMGIRGGSLVAEIDGQELLLGGDIILEVLGHRIRDGQSVLELRRSFNELETGDEFQVVILRNAKQLTLTGRVGG